MFDNIKPAITSTIVMLKCIKKLPSLIRPQIVLQILLGLEKRKVFMMPTLDKNSHKNRKNKIIRKEKITALIVTHDINQAISMSDKVIVLSNRPACVKNVYDIKLTNKSTPINNRKCVEFNDYFDLIWRDLDEKL